MREVVSMHQALKRQLFVVLAATLVAAIGTSVASASASKARFGRFSPRSSFSERGGFGPSFGSFGGPGGGGGFGFLGGFGGLGGGQGGAQGFGGLGLGGPGAGDNGGPGGAAVLGSDVLTPSASFLGVSVTVLEADLKGGNTLAQEAVAKGKTAADLITAIVAAQKTVFDAEIAAFRANLVHTGLPWDANLGPIVLFVSR
jgi:hypothetical protein